jgi:C2 domain
MFRYLIVLFLTSSLFLFGCGSKKPEVSGAASIGDADGGVEGDEGEEGAADEGPADEGAANGMLPEADTGDDDFPEPPKNENKRKALSFRVSLKKAYVLPLSEDGDCWDECSKDAKEAMIDALSDLSGEQFGSAAKALGTVMGAKGFKDVLPDIYVHIDCGYGQDFTTSKTSAENKLTARWRGVKESLMLDPNDQCAVSVWDGDEEGNDELIGSTIFSFAEKGDQGSIILTADEDDLGQVFMVELFFDQREGASVWGGGVATAPAAQPETKPEETRPETKPEIKPSEPIVPAKPAGPQKARYKVEVLKANLKRTKDDGQKWDTKIPYIGKAGDEMPDPYVEVYINGYQSENPFMSTVAAKNTMYYEWKKSGEASLLGTDKLHFMVWDKDKIDPDLIGECITKPVENLSLGSALVIRGCGQVDFVVVKVTKK